MEKITVTVAFRNKKQQWSHTFVVANGSTVRQLKEVMLRHEGTQQEVDSFELCLRGRRVPDTETIVVEQTLDFEWLGPEEGTKRAKEDVQEAARQKRMEESKKHPTSVSQSPTSQDSVSASQPKPATSQRNDVTVTHAHDDKKSSITIEMDKTATILELRRAIMAELGETKLSEVKIVKKQGQSFMSWADDQKLGERTQFLALGRKLDKPQLTSDLIIKVIIDQDLGIETTLTVKRGTTVYDLKEMLAKSDPTGQTKPEDMGLGVNRDGKVTALNSRTVLTDAHTLLESIEPGNEAPPEEEEVKPGPFTVDRAKQLQKDLYAAFSAPEFKKKLEALFAAHPTRSGGKFMQERQALYLSVQKDIIPKYGFEGNPKGVFHMMGSFGPFNSDPEVIRMGAAIEELLKV